MKNKTKWYISGNRNILQDYEEEYERAELWIRLKGGVALNPYVFNLFLQSSGVSQDEIKSLSFRLIDICDGIYMLKNWEESEEARDELEYAKANGKKVEFEDEQ